MFPHSRKTLLALLGGLACFTPGARDKSPFSSPSSSPRSARTRRSWS